MPGPRSRHLIDNMVFGEPRPMGSGSMPRRSPARPRLKGGISKDQWRRAMMRKGLPLPGGSTVNPRTMKLYDPLDPFVASPYENSGPRLPSADEIYSARSEVERIRAGKPFRADRDPFAE